MSALTTMLAWLIPCIIIVFGVIAYRVYVYKTRGPFVPSYLQRNIFARTRSFLPRTNSFSNKTADGGPAGSITTTPGQVPATALRNETRIDMTPSSSSQPPQSVATISHPIATPSPSGPGSDPSSISKPPLSPAISRLLSMK